MRICLAPVRYIYASNAATPNNARVSSPMKIVMCRQDLLLSACQRLASALPGLVPNVESLSLLSSVPFLPAAARSATALRAAPPAACDTVLRARGEDMLGELASDDLDLRGRCEATDDAPDAPRGKGEYPSASLGEYCGESGVPPRTSFAPASVPSNPDPPLP